MQNICILRLQKFAFKWTLGSKNKKPLPSSPPLLTVPNPSHLIPLPNCDITITITSSWEKSVSPNLLKSQTAYMVIEWKSYSGQYTLQMANKSKVIT